MEQHTCQSSIAFGQNKSKSEDLWPSEFITNPDHADGRSSHGGARRRSHGSSVSPLAFSVSRHGTHPLPHLLSPVLPRRILAGPARSSSSAVSFSFFIFVLECNGCVVFVCKTQCLWWRFDYWRSSAFHLGQLYQQSEYLSLRICLDAEKNGG